MNLYLQRLKKLVLETSGNTSPGASTTEVGIVFILIFDHKAHLIKLPIKNSSILVHTIFDEDFCYFLSSIGIKNRESVNEDQGDTEPIKESSK